MLRTAMGYLAAADPAAMSAQAQAECLHTLEQLDAVETAARARILAAFTAGHGYSEDADYSPTSWLIHRTRITKGAARGHLGWARRAAAHPGVIAALAEGTVLTESMARLICGWTGKLPEDCRDAADGILLTAARAGARTGGPGRAGRGDLRPVPARRPGRQRPAAELRGPAGAGGEHLRRGRGHRRRPHPRMRRGGHRGAGGAVGPGRGAGHPDQGPALPRRAGGCDAPPGRQWAAAGAGRAAGERLGARLAGRAARPG